jgi:hypothetical protein
MHYRQTWAAVGAVAALASLAACSGTTSTSPNDQGLNSQVSTDAASSTGQAVVADIAETGADGSDGSSYARVMPHGISASVLFKPSGGTCHQLNAPSDLRWFCGADTLVMQNSIANDTLIRARNFEFFALGTAQSAFTSATDSVNFGGGPVDTGVVVYGAVHRTRWNGVTHRIRNHAVTDHPSFTTDVDSSSTWNGNTLATDTAKFTGKIWTINYTGVANDTTVNVVFRRPRIVNPFPKSGEFHRWATWVYAATGPATKSGTVSRHIVVTYNGTSTAQLQVIGSTTLTCSLDLITGEVSNCQ